MVIGIDCGVELQHNFGRAISESDVRNAADLLSVTLLVEGTSEIENLVRLNDSPDYGADRKFELNVRHVSLDRLCPECRRSGEPRKFRCLQFCEAALAAPGCNFDSLRRRVGGSGNDLEMRCSGVTVLMKDIGKHFCSWFEVGGSGATSGAKFTIPVRSGREANLRRFFTPQHAALRQRTESTTNRSSRGQKIPAYSSQAALRRYPIRVF